MRVPPFLIAATLVPPSYHLKVVASTCAAAEAQSPGVEVFSTPGCRYCTKAKAFLRSRGVVFSDRDVSSNDVVMKDLLGRAVGTSLPQIFIGGEHVGGCDDMLREAKRGKLQSRLSKLGLELLDPPAEPEGGEAAGEEAGMPPVLLAETDVLNPPLGEAAGAASATDVSARLQREMLSLLDSHLSADGSRVNYRTLRTSAAFAAFCAAAGELGSLPPSALLEAAPAEQKAFWLNLYNCQVMHATISVGGPADAAARSAFFSGRSGGAYLVAGTRFSLDDIEHGVLRCNRAPPGAEAAPFDTADPRAAYSLRELDPRIHFALNCGARSCPPIKVYSAAALDAELALATAAFLESDLRLDAARNLVTCSKILDWYGADFGARPAALLERLRSLLPPESKLHAELTELLAADPDGSRLALEHRPYDWGLNDAPG